MKVVFSGYWGANYNEDLLGYPHDWVGDRFAEPLRVLKREGEKQGLTLYGCHFGDYKEADLFVFWERPKTDDRILRHALASGKPRVLLVTEPPGQIPLNADERNERLFDEIFSWYGPVKEHRHRMKPIYFAYPTSQDIVPFTERKFCTMIASIYTRENDPCELYSKRAETVRWFEQHHPDQMDFYGRQNRYTDTRFQIYRGPVKEKLPVLSQYKFQICYENSHAVPGYISEKIFDSFFAGCIPVYLGAENVQDVIPKECFIDRRDFESYEALYAYMMSIDETKYMEYQAHIQAFLKSDFAHSYDEKALTNTLLPVLVKLANSKRG